MGAGRPPILNLRLNSRPDGAGLIRAALGGLAAPFALRPELVNDLRTAISEACNNAVEHAYRDVQGVLRVCAEVQSGRLEVTVEDRGRWREVEPQADRGRGMLLIHRLMDSAEFRSDHGGTRAILRKRVSTGRPSGQERVAAPAGS